MLNIKNMLIDLVLSKDINNILRIGKYEISISKCNNYFLVSEFVLSEVYSLHRDYRVCNSSKVSDIDKLSSYLKLNANI